MRIGELARRVGVTADTIRFYERSGLLPRPARRANAYREYHEADVEHVRLIVELRRLDLPLDDAAQVASWCHSGHCADSGAVLPGMIAARRTLVAERIAGLQRLEGDLARLERHLTRPRLDVIGGPTACCDAAQAVHEGCACCSAVGKEVEP
jgi:DNA-binding transcriptional MerR regulator